MAKLHVLPLDMVKKRMQVQGFTANHHPGATPPPPPPPPLVPPVPPVPPPPPHHRHQYTSPSSSQHPSAKFCPPLSRGSRKGVHPVHRDGPTPRPPIDKVGRLGSSAPRSAHSVCAASWLLYPARARALSLSPTSSRTYAHTRTSPSPPPTLALTHARARLRTLMYHHRQY